MYHILLPHKRAKFIHHDILFSTLILHGCLQHSVLAWKEPVSIPSLCAVVGPGWPHSKTKIYNNKKTHKITSEQKTVFVAIPFARWLRHLIRCCLAWFPASSCLVIELASGALRHDMSSMITFMIFLRALLTYTCIMGTLSYACGRMYLYSVSSTPLSSVAASRMCILVTIRLFCLDIHLLSGQKQKHFFFNIYPAAFGQPRHCAGSLVLCLS